ncbi:MAG: hypothetical protein JJ978_11120 [Roseivirga sp.]|uniref:hypothetical protein n=1 Tax=Roseivirga sp. TaxID=1964215 RepID=UPI001AFE0B64|nr:hypothetical protein [Roseivirga sp.]MBO6496109.1 hypothetical protein [Roseivirga sp.]
MPEDAVIYLSRAHKILNDADVDISIKYSKDAVNDLDATIDAIQASGKSKPTWEEIKVLFKRGNDFNQKARQSYVFNEIHLENGKRLDFSVPRMQIVSRKATTLSSIQATTFENYLREFMTKYSSGTIVRSNKYNSSRIGEDAIDGQPLIGNYYLEIPSSNRYFLRIISYFRF